ncbi:MAG: alpha-amylase family glycosyl hydrolase [Desulfopila sp.]
MKELTVWAPNAARVELVKGDRSSFAPPLELVPTTVDFKGVSMAGFWALADAVPFPLRDGDGYWFKIEFTPGAPPRYRIDPYARAMQHSASYSIYKDPARFAWTDAGFRPPEFDAMVIYQVFQGGYCGRGDADWKDPEGNNYHFTWKEGRKGDFRQLRHKLDYIESLGVNAIELLPINEFNGDNYIGYSPVSYFAVESSYGSTKGDGTAYDELKAFINEAHVRSIAVIADVVYNHIGKVGDSGPLWNYDSTEHNIYFSGEEASNQSGGTFGMAPDWAKYEVQKYIEDSCVYFLDELHFDGLRFDFTSQIVNKNAHAGENCGREVLRGMLWRLKRRFAGKMLICEHWGEFTGEYEGWMIQYQNFDAGWFNFHRRLQEALWPFSSGNEQAIAEAINGGEYGEAHNRIIYANSHDECWWDGNGQPHKYYPVSEFLGWRGDYWSQRKARMMYALSFFVPGIPMFFMGDEFAMDGTFNDARYDYILDWNLEKLTPGPQFKRMFQTLIAIKKSYHPLMKRGSSFEWLHYPASGWFAFKRKWHADVLVIAGNYSGDHIFACPVPTNGETGGWRQIFNSDGQEFGGDGIGNYGNDPNTVAGAITINIPRNGVVAVSRRCI